MKLKHSHLLLLLFITLPLSKVYSLEVGEKITPFQLQDQHEKEQMVDTSIKLILFAKDDDANKMIAKALEKTKADYLPQRKALYVADISKMPGWVASWFALPKMRKYTYLTLLDRKPDVTKQFPAKTDEVTLIYLNNLSVEKIEYYKKPEELRKTLDTVLK